MLGPGSAPSKPSHLRLGHPGDLSTDDLLDPNVGPGLRCPVLDNSSWGSGRGYR